MPAARSEATRRWVFAIDSWSRSSASTTTGPGASAAATIGLLIARSAASSRDTPMEKPVAGTGSARKRATRPS